MLTTSHAALPASDIRSDVIYSADFERSMKTSPAKRSSILNVALYPLDGRSCGSAGNSSASEVRREGHKKRPRAAKNMTMEAARRLNTGIKNIVDVNRATSNSPLAAGLVGRKSQPLTSTSSPPWRTLGLLGGLAR